MRYLLSEIAAICQGRLYGVDNIVEAVVTDSRSLTCEFGRKPLFVAMQGVNHDSHDYIVEMFGRGVCSFIVETETLQDEDMSECGFVVVGSAIDALQRLAQHYRSQFEGVVVGITGSNGKTVIKEWIVDSLPEGVKVFRSPKSFNSQLGVALSLLMLEGDEVLALIESGISKCGEMERLERMIRPDMVIFTSIGDAHQDNFGSVEEKSLEKLILAKGARKIIYHSFYEPIGSLVESKYSDRELIDAAECRAVLEGSSYGEASGRNLQIVDAFCRAMGYSLPNLSVDHQPSVEMRLEVKDGLYGSILIDDAYNLDINSLALALDYMHIIAGDRARTLIISDIHQSGFSDEELYGRVAQMAESAGVDVLIGIGERIGKFASLFSVSRREFYLSTEEAIRYIGRDSIAGGVVLLKGGRNFRFERLTHALERKSHTTTLEVNLDAMISNLNYFRSKMDFSTKLVAMIKAGGYGAGDFEIAQMLQHQGVDYLAVAFADEGVGLRERGITMPIMVLNADADSFELMIDNRLEPEIYSLHSLREFGCAARRKGVSGYPIHLKLDTGMCRLGFVESDLEELIENLKCVDSVRVETIFSHLACADVVGGEESTRGQIDLYDSMSGRIVDGLGYPVVRHLANSAAIERFPEAHFDMCRLGLGLYGFGFSHNPTLRPVSTLKSRIVQIKHLNSDSRVGYGGAGEVSKGMITATVPIGYADGLNRHLGCGRWSMLVNGVAAPLVGRVCMDSCMIDITNVGAVAEGDEVTIFSPQKGNNVEDMAEILETIPYEIMTSISNRVKRIYIKE